MGRYYLHRLTKYGFVLKAVQVLRSRNRSMSITSSSKCHGRVKPVAAFYLPASGLRLARRGGSGGMDGFMKCQAQGPESRAKARTDWRLGNLRFSFA